MAIPFFQLFHPQTLKSSITPLSSHLSSNPWVNIISSTFKKHPVCSPSHYWHPSHHHLYLDWFPLSHPFSQFSFPLSMPEWSFKNLIQSMPTFSLKHQCFSKVYTTMHKAPHNLAPDLISHLSPLLFRSSHTRFSRSLLPPGHCITHSSISSQF